MSFFKKGLINFSLTLLLGISSLQAQFSENFSDGNFTANPAWVGGTADFVVNASQQLQSNNLVANASYWLSTASTKAQTAQWEMWVQLTFNTSSTNYVDIYLTASQSDLSAAATTGYFVRLGGTDDEICLFRKDANGSSTKIIDGLNATLNTSSNTIKLKITRNAANQWMLNRDLTGSGSSYTSEGTVTDATFTTSAFFGIFVRQSTASFFQRHFFDDIVVSNYVPDTTPPTLVSNNATNANTLELLFSEPLDAATAQNVNNYSANNGLGAPSTAVLSGSNPALVTLSFTNPFGNGVQNTLTITGIKDLAGNTISSTNTNFGFYVPGRYDIVIDEIMADPTPQVGLPNTEWLELKNTSRFPINLSGYRLLKPGGSPSGAFPALVLQPDSFLIVTGTSGASLMAPFGNTISVTSFPSLGNDGDLLMLQNAAGVLMHAVNYSINWYQNQVKADGGWTLEMIDTKNPCAAATNWRVSNNAIGGTPGKKNSLDAVNADAVAPQLLRAFAIDNVTLSLYFDEPLDSLKATLPTAYSVSDGIGAATKAVPVGPLFNKVNITLANAISSGKVYTVTATGITDCSGNSIGSANTAKVGLASLSDSLDLIVNEILFDPKPFGSDFVEIYNRSSKIIDLSTVNVANRSSTTGQVASITPITTDNFLLFPGEFAVLTPDPINLSSSYMVKNPAALITVPSLPSFPDTKGWAILINNQGKIVDELPYDAKWHFALVDNEEGISLERIDYNKPTNDASNWTSAAETAGFATPTYQNSQYRADLTLSGEITLNPKMFSPDNDGIEDFLLIEFQFPEPGYVANVNIYDAAGRPVRLLQRNTTCGTRGSWRWDGLDDKQKRVPAGTYIIRTDIFNLKDQKKTFKNTAVVARKF
jgi:hypothetical protein